MEYRLQRIYNMYPLLKSDFLIGYKTFIDNENLNLKNIFKPASMEVYFQKFIDEKIRLENLLFRIYEIQDMTIPGNVNFPVTVKQYLRNDVSAEVREWEQQFLLCLSSHNEKYKLNFSCLISPN